MDGIWYGRDGIHGDTKTAAFWKVTFGGAGVIGGHLNSSASGILIRTSGLIIPVAFIFLLSWIEKRVIVWHL
jgi:hypothetical protein